MCAAPNVLFDRPDRPGEGLESIFRSASFRARIIYAGQMCGGWAVDTSGPGLIAFHVVGAGTPWLHVPEEPSPILLRPGDVMMFPHDGRHVITEAPLLPTPLILDHGPFEVAMDRRAPGTALVCGYFEVEASARTMLTAALPSCLLVRAEAERGNSRIRQLLDLLFDEAADGESIGNRAILDRLADALFLYVLRHVVREGLATGGILAGLADRSLARALDAIVASPSRRWTVEAMAALAFMSRSAFAERFTSVVGHAPMEFVTRWRMMLARRWLSSGEGSIADIAERCGYASEVAFAKAFKRETGMGPGQWRRQGLPAAFSGTAGKPLAD